MPERYCDNVTECGNFAAPNSNLCYECMSQEQAPKKKKGVNIDYLYEYLTTKPSKQKYGRHERTGEK